MPGLFAELEWRGLVHQVTDSETLPKLLEQDRLTAYIGFDPTAESLHVGSLVQICNLRRLLEAGHRPIALIGGGTGMIGDPSGKTEERALLTPDQLDAHRLAIKDQLGRLVDTGDGGVVLADNADWLAIVPLLEFLRDVGKLFSVNEMIRKESVRARLEQREHGISFTEFSYMLLQAWDFLQLYDRYGCRLQLGGSDQWGNITEGVELIRRTREVQSFGLTSPLVVKADGTKFGKTESGNVWLDPARTSPYEFFQFWLRTSDADVGPYLRYFTFLERAAIEELDASTRDRPEARQAQRVLARQVTAMVHGAEEAARAERAAAVLFTEEVAGLDEASLAAGLADAPTTPLPKAELSGGGLTLVDAMVRTGVAGSKGDARRQIEGGGVYVNNRRQAADRSLGPDDALHGRFVILRRGKRQHVLRVDG
jgi:tyrosyl-tRNA synthetase